MILAVDEQLSRMRH